MASPTYSFLQPFVNLVPGQVEVAAKRVDADAINLFGTDLARASAVRGTYGDKAADAGSNPVRCSLTLKSDSLRTGVIKAGDWYKVTELGTGSVWTGTAQIDDVTAFSTLGGAGDGLLVEGAAPGAGYDAPAFWADLRIEIRHQLVSRVQVEQINLTDGAVGALQTNDIARPGGAILETDMAADETAFAVGHNAGTGAHNAGVIDEAMFADTAFENFNYANLLANGGAEAGEAAAGEADPDNILFNPPFYWSAVAGREPDALFLTTTTPYEGRYCCQATFSAANQAVDQEFDPLEFDVTQHRGKYVALTVAVLAAEADSIKVGFNGAVGAEDLCATAGGVAATWTILTHIMQIDALETAITARCVNQFAGANVTLFDAAITVLGSKPVAYSRSTWEAGAIRARDASIFNLALNNLFSYWTNGVAVDPDCWESGGLATCIQEAVAANVARGDFSAHVTLPDDAASFSHRVGYSPTNKCAEALRGRYVTAKFKVKWVAGTRNLHATLLSNVAGNSKTISIDLPNAADFNPCAIIALEVGAAATDLYLQFENLDAGAPTPIEFYLDDVQITPTPWPCAPIIPNFWTIQTEEWTYSGSCDPTMGDVDLFKGNVGIFAVNQGVQAGFYGVALRVYVESNTAPAVATTFDLIHLGAPIDSITLTNPATEAQAHTNAPGAWNRITPENNLRVLAAAGGSAVEDVVVRWVFLKSAANTSEV